ncbi:MAG: prepilin-type N-terminal cleavage/methylation domain-containing protein [Myxococcales bacterium]|nr:prepilin-type N-terminal cleavage/methylation domain-containing protein [Myxococcales bacterium]
MRPPIDILAAGGSSLSRHPRSNGFTTIELLVGVAIVGILAAVAIPSFKGYVYRGRVTEAVTVLNEIKTRQEAYRSRFGNYAAVNGNTWGTFTPAAVPGSQAVGWPSSPAWEQLGIRPPGFVRFRYATIAGFPQEAPPASTNLEWDRNFWYAAQAEGDLDDDGDTFILEVYSQSRNMFNSAAGTGGWE